MKGKFSPGIVRTKHLTVFVADLRKFQNIRKLVSTYTVVQLKVLKNQIFEVVSVIFFLTVNFIAFLKCYPDI